jgi:glycine betaine/proline transport system ATP-binding protein
VGTPEELVTRPATDYVREFTRDVQRAKVISARSLMRPAVSSASEYAGRVAAGAKIASFAAQIVAAGRAFAVVDGTGAILGEVAPEKVIDLLAGRDMPR